MMISKSRSTTSEEIPVDAGVSYSCFNTNILTRSPSRAGITRFAVWETKIAGNRDGKARGNREAF